jgi:hypothetical protein
MKIALLTAIKSFLFPSSSSHTRSTSGGARHGLTHVCIGLTLLCAWSLPLAEITQVEDVRLRLNESEVDAILQRAATDSLGEREGTIIVLDAQTGRVRAVVNPRLAAQSAFRPAPPSNLSHCSPRFAHAPSNRMRGSPVANITRAAGLISPVRIPSIIRRSIPLRLLRIPVIITSPASPKDFPTKSSTRRSPLTI